ncbi:NAD(P)/FAD-dependent oxidoreductase [Candidatus Micrarchaeota archaeon]|nr:NAD(P)/FAD-dependent oxidoreductase [Candidatus Micrarchaeota archaeon]
MGFDVHVVGGGPSGSISAISALRNNFNVVVSEEHERSGFPVRCSGLISKNGLDYLSKYVDYKKHIINFLRGAIVYVGKEQLIFDAKETNAYVVDRASFDQELMWNAEIEGAKLEFSKRITNKFQARNIIAADGPLSTIASNLGFPSIKKYAVTLQAFVKRNARKDFVEVFISSKNYPGLFGWYIPHNEEYGEVGVGTLLPNNPSLAFRHLMKRLKIVNYPTPTGALIPLRLRKKTAVNGKRNVLLVGDAAGQVKSSTGGGVVMGGRCAEIAGRFADNPEMYEREWKGKYMADFLMHKSIQSFISLNPDVVLEKTAILFRKLGGISLLEGAREMDMPTRILPSLLTAKRMFK